MAMNANQTWWRDGESRAVDATVATAYFAGSPLKYTANGVSLCLATDAVGSYAGIAQNARSQDVVENNATILVPPCDISLTEDNAGELFTGGGWAVNARVYLSDTGRWSTTASGTGGADTGAKGKVISNTGTAAAPGTVRILFNES